MVENVRNNMSDLDLDIKDGNITYTTIEAVNQTLNKTDIKGKDYVEVNERIKAFRMLYPQGSIQTEMISNADGVCVFKAIVGYYNDDATILKVLGTGYAYEKEGSTYINKTSYIENAETSAVGRALGMCGLGIDKSLASAEEVENAKQMQDELATQKIEQMQVILKLIEETGVDLEKIKNKYEIPSLDKANDKQLAEIEKTLKKHKEILDKVA